MGHASAQKPWLASVTTVVSAAVALMSVAKSAAVALARCRGAKGRVVQICRLRRLPREWQMKSVPVEREVPQCRCGRLAPAASGRSKHSELSIRLLAEGRCLAPCPGAVLWRGQSWRGCLRKRSPSGRSACLQGQRSGGKHIAGAGANLQHDRRHLHAKCVSSCKRYRQAAFSCTFPSTLPSVSSSKVGRGCFMLVVCVLCVFVCGVPAGWWRALLRQHPRAQTSPALAQSGASSVYSANAVNKNDEVSFQDASP